MKTQREDQGDESALPIKYNEYSAPKEYDENAEKKGRGYEDMESIIGAASPIFVVGSLGMKQMAEKYFLKSELQARDEIRSVTLSNKGMNYTGIEKNIDYGYKALSTANGLVILATVGVVCLGRIIGKYFSELIDNHQANKVKMPK